MLRAASTAHSLRRAMGEVGAALGEVGTRSGGASPALPLTRGMATLGIHQPELVGE